MNTTNTTNRTIESYIESYSDFHKDAYGFRPRSLPNFTVEQWAEEFARLSRACEARNAEEAAFEAAAVVEFEATVSKLIRQGANDRATAVRWLDEANHANGDKDYLGFLFGLPWKYLSK